MKKLVFTSIILLISVFIILPQANIENSYNQAQVLMNEGDFESAFFLYKKSAEAGHLGAQRNLGLLYLTGNGIDQDLEKAIYWLQISSEQGDIDA